MEKFRIVPNIIEYNTFIDFSKDFNLCDKDLIITNKYILEAVGNPGNCKVIYQENYGQGEPTDLMVNGILKDLSYTSYDRIVAIGGGTVIDIAKVIAVAGKETDVNALYGKMDNLNKEHELFIVPTTCGTGSEVTNISIVNRTALETKQGLVSEKMYAEYAILIEQFIKTIPYGVFATSSLDALIHAIESYLSPNSSQYSRLFSIEAMKIIIDGYKKIIDNSEALSDLGGSFLRASNYAGIAFSNAGCATIHAMSYAFGSKFHVAHGESNYQFLIAVLKFYQEKNPDGKIKTLFEILDNILDGDDILSGLKNILDKILKRKPMREYGASKEDIDIFAKSTFENQQRLLKNSYVEITQKDIATIYESCL